MSKITLIIGGIRSGKSHFAEKKTLEWATNPLYIATGIPFDKEMEERVAIHKKRRKNDFETIEEPLDVNVILQNIQNRTILIDCLTLNISNRLLRNENNDLAFHITDLDHYLHTMISIIRANNLRVFFVSNEVGTSPVSINRLGRFFQDLQGRLNCIIASASDEVYMLECGIPRVLKKKPNRPFKLGAPSYVLPSDYISNVVYLQDKVDDIQLLLFDSTADDPLFKDETFFTLHYLMNGSGFTFSAHMSAMPASENDFEIKKNEFSKIIEKLLTLNVTRYTIHYDLPVIDNDSQYPIVKKKYDALCINFITCLKEKFPTIDLNLENVKTKLSALDDVVKACNITYCADIGHYLLQGFNLQDISERLDSISVIHLHGLKETGNGIKDHEAFTGNLEVFSILEKFTGVVTIENYHTESLKKSISYIDSYF